MGVEKCNCESYTDYLCEFACSSKVCPGPDNPNCPEHPDYYDEEEDEEKIKDKDGSEPEGPGI